MGTDSYKDISNMRSAVKYIKRINETPVNYNIQFNKIQIKKHTARLENASSTSNWVNVSDAML